MVLLKRRRSSRVNLEAMCSVVARRMLYVKGVTTCCWRSSRTPLGDHVYACIPQTSPLTMAIPL
eukprot:5636724-Amphidinium_carterae.2